MYDATVVDYKVVDKSQIEDSITNKRKATNRLN